MFSENTKTPDELTPEETARLEEVLAHHGIGKYDYEKYNTLSYACLSCGSIGESPSVKDRDYFVENFDFTCCGVTVYWHSSNNPPYDPAELDDEKVLQLDVQKTLGMMEDYIKLARKALADEYEGNFRYYIGQLSGHANNLRRLTEKW